MSFERALVWTAALVAAATGLVWIALVEPREGAVRGRSAPLAPAPPSSYALPATATTVATSEELERALAGPTAAIVLADGTYEAPEAFTDANGSSLYAEHPGRAVLAAGLELGGNDGPGGAVVQGLAFDVGDPSRTFEGGEVTIWGPSGKDASVLDCTFEGNGRIEVGLLANDPDGLVARRLVLRDFLDEGIRASDNETVGYGEPTQVIRAISDIDVEGVAHAVPGSSDGRAEAGLFIGQPVHEGVSRIRVRNVAISGIETANDAWDTTYSDLDIDMSGPKAASGVGIYLEHFTRHDVFTTFSLAGVRVGVNGEWDGGRSGAAAVHDVTIEHGTIDAAGAPGTSRRVGIHLDEGSESTTVRDVTFRGQDFAGISAFRTTGANAFSANRYELPSGAAETTTEQLP